MKIGSEGAVLRAGVYDKVETVERVRERRNVV